MKRCSPGARMLLMALCFSIALVVFPASAEQAILTEIDPYVVRSDVRTYLTDADMALYEKLVDAMFARESRVMLSKDYDANLRAFGALRSNPYYFFVEKLTFTNSHDAVNLTYSYSEAEQNEMRAYIDDEFLSILNGIIKPGMNELEKTLAVYGYFSERIEYDYEWADALSLDEEKFMFPEILIYQALSTNKGVCHSYAYLTEFALRQLGMECLLFTGTMAYEPDVGHMWPVVRIDGDYYHIDPTWDHQEQGGAGLNYFGMTDDERRASGAVNFETSYDGAYGEIHCDREVFAPFRGVRHFSIPENFQHEILLEYDDHAAVYNTLTKAITDQ